MIPNCSNFLIIIIFREGYNPETMNDSYEKEEAAPWRRDPRESFSDWTIKVVLAENDDDSRNNGHCEGENSDDIDGMLDDLLDDSNDSNRTNPQSPRTISPTDSVYNVHKVFLASGPRKSEYFQTLFSLNTNTRESLSETTTLVMPESACMAFPRFLDFVYETTNGERGQISWEEDEDVYSSLIANGCGDDSVDCDSDSEIGTDDSDIRQEVALDFLADYLRVPTLACRTRERIKGLLNLRNVHLVCKEALVYSIDWILEDCLEVASESPRDLLEASDPQSGSLRHNAQRNPFLFDDHERSRLLVPPALQTLWMLSPEKQMELFRRALSKTLRDPGRFQPAEDDEYNYQFRT